MVRNLLATVMILAVLILQWVSPYALLPVKITLALGVVAALWIPQQVFDRERAHRR